MGYDRYTFGNTLILDQYVQENIGDLLYSRYQKYISQSAQFDFLIKVVSVLTMTN